MSYEIDFIAIGDGSSSGDAIAIRFGDLSHPDSQFVMLIDAGYAKDGEKIVSFVRDQYGTNRVNLVISSHPDSDHSGGLAHVLEELDVDELWMHLPWEHSSDIRSMFKDGRLTDSSLSDHLKKSLQDVHDIYEVSLSNAVPVSEPFSDVDMGLQCVYILSPSTEYYQALIPNFRGTPASKDATSFASILSSFAKDVVQWFKETWVSDLLEDPPDGATSSENNSSTVVLVVAEDEQFLFTADAGVPSLEQACESANSLGVDLQKTCIVQIPHHGSKRNVGPTLLDRLIGNIVERDEVTRGIAVVSAASDGAPKHPSQRVLNAFLRRGYRVRATCGKHYCKYSSDVSRREGWAPATVYEFVEEYQE